MERELIRERTNAGLGASRSGPQGRSHVNKLRGKGISHRSKLPQRTKTAENSQQLLKTSQE
jgi:hypothetical protein